ncbi:hypothetical protein J3R30DRAFT_3696225 [Lentinula aciculospora]|uniref:Uncharacterized protein n=1 Tax=Lentinula aciculospora TaxID=153920 RepID=A0A9W9DVE8_9AGAR|nr:hypothetical protein J3R30DRAFT_3696225 [Lentinula aciculospora]
MAGLPPRPTFTPERRSSPPLRRRERDDRPYPQSHTFEQRRDDYRRDRDRDYDRGRRSPPRWDDRDRDRRGPPPPGYRDSSGERGRMRGPPRTPPRSPPRPPYDRDRDRDRFPPGNRYRSPPRRRPSPPPTHRGRRFSRSRSPPRRYSLSPPTRSPPRRHARAVSPMRAPGSSRFRSRSPRYPPPKRVKLGSHSIGSPATRSPERIRYRSQSRDSRYRAPSRDRKRSSPGPPQERRPRRDPDSPRDEGEIREYDTPERDRPATLVREPPPSLPVLEEIKVSIPSTRAIPHPPLPKIVVENDIKPKSPVPEPAPISLLPNSLPPTPQAPVKQPIRSLSPPKHPRNWSESRPSESSLFIPPSIRRGRGRGSSAPYRGGTYRGGGPPDAPRAPRNRGPSQASVEQEHQPETTIASTGVDSAPSPAGTSKSKAETPPSAPPVEPEDSIEQLLKWVNEKLIVTDMIQEERKMMDRSKVLRDEYLVAHQHTHQLILDHYKITNSAHRALHEFEMANLELKHSQLRRQGLNKQQELARLGLLGMDYEPDGSGISTPGW